MLLKILCYSLITALAAALSACTLTSGPVTGSALRPFEPTPKSITMLSDGPYVEEMSAALLAAGFSVESNAVPGKEISTRYSSRFNFTTGRISCVFTSSLIGDALLTVVDSRSGETVAQIRQSGATGPCTSVDPVYPTLAAELSRLWNVSSKALR